MPGLFSDAQRRATKDAARIAGLDVLRLIHEPTAAASTYGSYGNHLGQVAVLDAGGGTFDISVVNIADGAVEVLSTAGDTHMGGEDFTN